MRLLINGGDWNTVAYVAKLRRNKYNVWYFKGYKDHPDGDGSKIWDYNKTKREAGLDGKRKIGSLKKKSSNKKTRKK